MILQGLLKVGQSREDKLRRIALKVDEADITFALQVLEQDVLLIIVPVACFPDHPTYSLFLMISPKSNFHNLLYSEQGVRFFRNCLQ